jgi:hypothetical protein
VVSNFLGPSPHGTKFNGIVATDLVFPVVGEASRTCFRIVIQLEKSKWSKCKSMPNFRAASVHHAQAFRHDFFANAVHRQSLQCGAVSWSILYNEISLCFAGVCGAPAGLARTRSRQGDAHQGDRP